MNKREHLNGIAPNWVHSMDATALRMAVLDSKVNGITAFAMIHDSFGTHAGNTDLFATCIRQSFVDLSSNHDPLQSFMDEQRAVMGEGAEIGPLPAKGSLDLSLVKESEFFFA